MNFGRSVENEIALSASFWEFFGNNLKPLLPRATSFFSLLVLKNSNIVRVNKELSSGFRFELDLLNTVFPNTYLREKQKSPQYHSLPSQFLLERLTLHSDLAN